MATLDKDKVVGLLNQILEQELAGVVRYTHYSLRRGSKAGHTRSWVGAAGMGDGTFGFSPVRRVWTEVLARRSGRCPRAAARTWPSRRWPVRRRSATWPPGTG